MAARVTLGTLTWPSKASATAYIRGYMRKHILINGDYSAIRVPQSDVDAWVTALVESHPHAAEKIKEDEHKWLVHAVPELSLVVATKPVRRHAGWTGEILIKRLMGSPCLFLVKQEGPPEEISVSKSINGCTPVRPRVGRRAATDEGPLGARGMRVWERP